MIALNIFVLLNSANFHCYSVQFGLLLQKLENETRLVGQVVRVVTCLPQRKIIFNPKSEKLYCQNAFLIK